MNSYQSNYSPMGEVSRQYIDTELGFLVDYPEGWETVTLSKDLYRGVASEAVIGFNPVNLTTDYQHAISASKMSLVDVEKALEQKASSSNAVISDRAEAAIAGQKGIKLTQVNQADTTNITEYYLVEHNNFTFILEFHVGAPYLASSAEYMLAMFKFVK